MKLYVITSLWLAPNIYSGENQNLTSVLPAASEAEAILAHTKYGDGKWPNMSHVTSKLSCTDISDTAREFARENPK